MNKKEFNKIINNPVFEREYKVNGLPYCSVLIEVINSECVMELPYYLIKVYNRNKQDVFRMPVAGAREESFEDFAMKAIELAVRCGKLKPAALIPKFRYSTNEDDDLDFYNDDE